MIEVIIATALVAVLVTLAVGQYSEYVERARVATAKADISMMSLDVQRYFTANRALPDTLDQVGRSGFLDPWGNAYHYVNLTGKSKGKARKDHKLNPLNSDYDLFSAGKNGVFKPQVSQKDSLDDVIRARDGSFIDLASEF